MDCYSQAKVGSVRVWDHLNYYAEPALSSESKRRCDSSQDRLSLSSSGDGLVRLKKDWFQNLLNCLSKIVLRSCELKTKLEDVRKKKNSFV